MEEISKEQAKLDRKRFQSRMGLAYISMFGIFLFTILLWFFVPENRLEICSNTAFYVYFGFTGVIGAAMGFKSWTELKK